MSLMVEAHKTVPVYKRSEAEAEGPSISSNIFSSTSTKSTKQQKRDGKANEQPLDKQPGMRKERDRLKRQCTSPLSPTTEQHIAGS